MLPSASITKISGGSAAAVAPSATGILAIIAASAKGQQNLVAAYGNASNLYNDYGVGPLAEYGTYDIDASGNSILVIRPTTSTPGSYLNFSAAGVLGTSAVTTGPGTPLDEFAFVQVTVVTGGTIGVSGITYKVTPDGGTNVSGTLALGTANTITVKNPDGSSTGVQFSLGAGTLLAGDTWTVYTTRPQMTNGDLITALEALRITSTPWENVLIDQDATSTTVNTVDAWLAGLESAGGFHGAFLNSRHKTEPVPTAESEATFAAAMATQFNPVAASASLAICVGADAGDLPSLISGTVQPRPVSLALAARCSLIPLGEDPAFVARGPVPGFGIADGQGNPKWHNEILYPDLDNLRLSTFTTEPGQNGVFITNGNVLSPAGSAFVYAQHMRCMNAACTQAFAKMVQALGKGVGKKPKDPTTGAVYILEQDAAAIEQDITAALRLALKGQVQDVAFVLSRTDDLSSNSGAIIHAQVQIEALAYIKQFVGTAAFVKTISVNV